MDTEELYAKFRRILTEAAHYRSAAALLDWDVQTGMPKNGNDARAEVIACLEGKHHELLVSPQYEDVLLALSETAEAGALDATRAVAVRLALRDFEREKRLPIAFVSERAGLCAASHNVWQEARAKSDFAAFLPNLKRLVEMKRQEAAFIDPAAPPYDVLLDEYEPGAKTAEVAKMLGDLRDFLTPFLARLMAAKDPPDPKYALIPAPFEAQVRLCRLVAEKFGLDFAGARLDASAHPFTNRMHPGDVRITTRYRDDDLYYALSSTAHETGHALYEQAMPKELWGTPAGEVPGLGIHESQSRLWENMVARSRPFIDFLCMSLLKEGIYVAWPDRFHRAVNLVEPSLIRTEADEVTYNLHVIVRFEIELDLIEGRLEAADIPEAWNSRMKKYLGLDVPDAARGCLQDVHWSMGSIGYFPTYSLGNLRSAQIYSAAARDLPGLEDDFRRGDFSRLLGWLRERVYATAGLAPASEIVTLATGNPPSASYFIDYLEKKYGEIYKL